VSQPGINSGAANHALHRGDVRARKAPLAEQSPCKLGAAIDVGRGVLCASPFDVIALLEIAGVVQKNAEDTELEQSFGKGTLTVGALPCMQQSSHAEGALER